MKQVSILLPVLNEEKTIENCIESLLNQDYPINDLQIVIAYGPSDDNTIEIIKQYDNRYDNIVIHPNPSGNTAWGRNICLMKSTGEYVMNYSGHAIAEPGLIKTLVHRIEQAGDDVVAVGCSNITPQEQTIVGKSAGFVFNTFIGGKGLFVQNESYDTERFVDHISFALYKKKIVDQVGRFDTHFWCGQDAELDLRLKKQGYKIIYTPDTKVFHYKRDTYISLFKQMYRYGLARAKMGIKHRGTLKPQHYLGLLFLLFLILGLLLTLSYGPSILFIFSGLYVVGCIGSVFTFSDIFDSLISPIPAFIIHSGYGFGFLGGYIYGRIIMR